MIIHGEAEKELQKIESFSIDCIITDPPYGLNQGAWDKSLFNYPAIIPEYFRVLKETGSLFLFCGWSNLQELLNFETDFKLNDLICYDRIKGRGGKKRLTSTREEILWFVKSDKWTFNKELAYSTIVKKTGGLGLKNGKKYRSLSNVWTDISPIVPWSKDRYKHPTQKPLKLMERIVTVFTNENDLILDTYAGTGTTGVACKNLNRNYILIEKEKEYIDIIKDRLFS